MLSPERIIHLGELYKRVERLRELLTRLWPEFLVGQPVLLTALAVRTTGRFDWTPAEMLRVLRTMRDGGEVELIQSPMPWTPAGPEQAKACIETDSGRWVMGFRLACCDSRHGKARRREQGRRGSRGGR